MCQDDLQMLYLIIYKRRSCFRSLILLLHITELSIWKLKSNEYFILKQEYASTEL